MGIKFLLVLFLLLSFCFIAAKAADNISFQDTTVVRKKKKTTFEKSIFVGYDFHNRILVGFSGPQLMFRVNDDLKIGPAYYPALWWNYKTGETDTKLGVGFRIDYKFSIIGFNTFRVGSLWFGSLIVGCKF